MRDEKVTLALGVPTVWLMLFNHVESEKLNPMTELKLKRVVIGGSAAPRAMIEKFETQVRRARRARLGHDRDVAAGNGLQPPARSMHALDLRAAS